MSITKFSTVYAGHIDLGATWFPAKQSALEVFAQHDRRVEGWFKGEMLLCLDDLRKPGLVDECVKLWRDTSYTTAMRAPRARV